MQDTHTKQNKHITLWLKIMCLAVIFMIFIGGLTRLTHSGLSITEWKPVTGIIPPLNAESWNEEFNQYKESPEYLQVNNGMDLLEFKSIFWIEFIHRIAGRITGILYLVPFIFFIINRTISGKEIIIYLAGFILLIGQGFAGWYMVKSGLISNPNVSHFRLAIHLLLAIFLFSLLFWQLMKNSFEKMILSSKAYLSPVNNWLTISLVVLFIQIIFGAFVAGLHAGLVHNSFPLMGGSIIPYEMTNTKITLENFSDPVFIQFMHRIIAYITIITVLFTCFIGFKIQNLLLAKVLLYVILTLVFQVTAGILTLIYSVPIIIALLHQLGAVIMLAVILWAKYLVVSARNLASDNI